MAGRARGTESGVGAAVGVAVLAPAKLNLSLAVLTRRDDGYHEIESLMVPVSLHDDVVVRVRAAPGIHLRLVPGGAVAAAHDAIRTVPADATNLAVRAAAALAEAAGETRGLEIDLAKRIPAGAGLGGGSSDAAAVLAAAARAWGIDWPTARLAAIGATIGSDVPWFFAGGPGIARGRGEAVEPVAGIPPLAAVIACPRAGLSTAAVYAGCTPDPAGRGSAARLAEALATGGLRAALPWLANDLEPPARRLCGEIDDLLDALTRAGGFAPRLTGSGSACFALARTAVEAQGIAARLAAQRHADGGRRWPAVYAVRLVTTAPSTSGPRRQVTGACS